MSMSSPSYLNNQEQMFRPRKLHVISVQENNMCRGCEGFFFCVASEGEEAAARVDDAVLRGDWWLLCCGGLASKLLRNPAEVGAGAHASAAACVRPHSIDHMPIHPTRISNPTP
jgi:hypothetical protein